MHKIKGTAVYCGLQGMKYTDQFLERYQQLLNKAKHALSKLMSRAWYEFCNILQMACQIRLHEAVYNDSAQKAGS